MNIISSLSLLLSLHVLVVNADPQIFDVTQFGAKSDDLTDISLALTNAWAKACASATPSKVLIPAGKYVVGTVGMEGPCKSEVHVQIDGYLKAQIVGLRRLSWITFSGLKNLVLFGSGTLDGQGPTAAKLPENRKNKVGMPLAVNLRLESITNGLIEGLTSKDSRSFHVHISRSSNITVRGLTVTAPPDSPDTVGIYLRRTHRVNISDVAIATGDHCINLADGSQQVNVRNVTCGPGGRTGILVDSLGKTPDEEKVMDVAVTNCSFHGTGGGVRIEAVPGTINTAMDITFEDLVMDKVENPISVDQKFCPVQSCEKVEPKVTIKDVSFKNIKGTCASPLAIDISCSSASFCKNLELADIDLKPVGTAAGPTAQTLKSQCTNVKVIKSGLVSPDGC
ncbi:unnamed protein product [Linum trigynum]|uniref:Uncharacterized protein n=1 Tax=Linum trigynum TaxID=586398 RepID=A0AAV2GGJ5_9ROSI